MSWALITNDDGIDAPGLHALAASAAATGLRVVVAAPATQASGAGAAVTITMRDGQVPVSRHELPGLDGVPAYGVAGAPAFIALAAVQGWFPEPPSLVLSGTNYGANLGYAIMHSGTVGAALTAGRFGIRALAVSLDFEPGAPVGTSRRSGGGPAEEPADEPDARPVDGPGATARWDAVGAVLPEVLEALTASPEGTVFTLNVPNLAPERLRPLRPARLARHGTARTRVDNVAGGLRIGLLERSRTAEPDSDVALLSAGHPTLTAVRAVTEDPSIALTDLLSTAVDRPG